MKVRAILLLLALTALGWVACLMLDSRRLERMASSPDASLIATPRELSEASLLPLEAAGGATGEARIALESQTIDEASSSEVSSRAKFERVVLHGIVHPAPGTGELIGKVRLSIVSGDGRRSSASVMQDGRYYVDLTPGPWWLHVSSDQNGSARATIELDESSRTREFDIALELGFEILIKVVDFSSAPIDPTGLSAIATTVAPGEWLNMRDDRLDRPSVIGFFDSRLHAQESVPSGYFGRVRPDRQQPLYLSLLRSHRVLSTQRVEADQREVEFVLDPSSASFAPGSLRARFVDGRTRKPVPDARVRLSLTAHTGIPVRPDGTLFVPRCPPGWVTIDAGNKESAVSLSALIEPGVENDLGDIAMEPVIELAGFVRDETGNGVGFDLEFSRIDPKTGSSEAKQLISSANDGTFRFRCVPHSRYRLQPHELNGALTIATKFVDVRASSVDNVQLRVERSVAMVIRPSVEDWGGARFAIRDSTGGAMFTSRFKGPEPVSILLAPGEYVVETRLSDAQESTFKNVCLKGEPVSVALP